MMRLLAQSWPILGLQTFSTACSLTMARNRLAYLDNVAFVQNALIHF